MGTYGEGAFIQGGQNVQVKEEVVGLAKDTTLGGTSLSIPYAKTILGKLDQLIAIEQQQQVVPTPAPVKPSTTTLLHR